MDQNKTTRSLPSLLEGVREWVLLQGKLGKKRFYLPFHKILDHPQDSLPDHQESLGAIPFEKVRETALSCTRCALSKSRTQVVFGTGNEKAQLMFVGEAPGFDEDRQGEPFVGKAGQLLTKMIQAMGLQRKDVYIANIVKCRPPENRTPRPEEIEACHDYLAVQISHIKPKVVCALGNVAAQTLLKTEKTISRLRGMFFEMGEIKVMPTFHPAFLLRNPEYKREVWHDLKLIMEVLKK